MLSVLFSDQTFGQRKVVDSYREAVLATVAGLEARKKPSDTIKWVPWAAESRANRAVVVDKAGNLTGVEASILGKEEHHDPIDDQIGAIDLAIKALKTERAKLIVKQEKAKAAA
jgi:hypothetical protein